MKTSLILCNKRGEYQQKQMPTKQNTQDIGTGVR